jgi:hypothetical protein
MPDPGAAGRRAAGLRGERQHGGTGERDAEAFRARGLADVPSVGILAAGVPAAFGAFVTALERWARCR